MIMTIQTVLSVEPQEIPVPSKLQNERCYLQVTALLSRCSIKPPSLMLTLTPLLTLQDEGPLTQQ